MASKAEYPPILECGFHTMMLPELRSLCVDNFPNSTTREAIMAGLEGVIQRLRAAGLKAEVWVDGSFLTKKNDPEDSDILVAVNAAFADNATIVQQETLEWLITDLKPSHRCDSYVHIYYDMSDPRFSEGLWRQSYWIKQFGFSRSEAMKGMAVIKTP